MTSLTLFCTLLLATTGALSQTVPFLPNIPGINAGASFLQQLFSPFINPNGGFQIPNFQSIVRPPPQLSQFIPFPGFQGIINNRPQGTVPQPAPAASSILQTTVPPVAIVTPLSTGAPNSNPQFQNLNAPPISSAVPGAPALPGSTLENLNAPPISSVVPGAPTLPGSAIVAGTTPQ